MGHLNIGPVYRVGQVEIEHSSKTSLIQETEGENLPREWDFGPLCGAVNYCVFRASRGFAPWTPTTALHWTYLGLTAPPDPRIGGQRTAFEIHHCTKCKHLQLSFALFRVNLSLTSIIICLRFIHKTSLSIKIVRISFLMLQTS